jgi:Spy/CpxP family protein refolding chaperone
MNRRTLFFASLSLMILVPALLIAQPDCRRPQRGPGMNCLGLDAEQHLKMEKLRLEHQLANIDLRAEQMGLRAKIKEELLKEEPSRKTIEKYAKSMSANREKMQMSRLDHMLAVKKILKPEQWQHFVEHHAEMMCGGGMRGCCHGDGMMGRCRGGSKGMMGKAMMRHREGADPKGACPYKEALDTEE